MAKRLYRSETDRMIAGVCGGLGDYFEVDPVLIRLAFVLLALASGAGIIAYIVLWIITPRASRADMAPKPGAKEEPAEPRSNSNEVRDKARETFRAEATPGEEPTAPAVPGRRAAGTYFVGALLILLGLLFLLSTLRLFWWFQFGRLWPLILIFIGIALLLRRQPR